MPLVGIILGSSSDWETMRHAGETLTKFGVEFEAKVASAHRAPDLVVEYAQQARGRGLKVIIACAGGAAALPGAVAAKTPLPVLGVPAPSVLLGVDSLLSMVQMPAGIPVMTLAVGKAGAINAALSAVAILATGDERLADKLDRFRAQQTQAVLDAPPLTL